MWQNYGTVWLAVLLILLGLYFASLFLGKIEGRSNMWQVFAMRVLSLIVSSVSITFGVWLFLKVLNVPVLIN